MSIRRHALLLFFLCGWLPAVGLACVLFGFGEYERKAQLNERTRAEAEQTARRLHAALTGRERQLTLLTHAAPVVEYLRGTASLSDPTHPRSNAPAIPAAITELCRSFDELNGSDLRAVYAFDPGGQPLLAGEKAGGAATGLELKPTRSIPQVTLDQTTREMTGKGAPFATVIQDGIARYYLPVKGAQGWALLVIDTSFDSLLRQELSGDSATQGRRIRMVLDQRGVLLSELPPNIRFQPVSLIFPEFAGLIPQLPAGRAGSAIIFDHGVPNFVAYQPVGSLGLTLAVMQPRNSFARMPGLVFIGALIGITILFLAVARWHQTGMRRDRLAIDKVAQSAADVAGGKITQPVEIDAGPELQKLAANFNLMIGKLREQIAREAEARQFQAFMRLSATITHDLKNAIQALSLLVSNLEEYFDDPAFRVHAVQGLTRSTETLNALIARLSEPMRSLSGEMPRPQPTDVANMLRRVLSATAGHDRSRHELIVDLPDRLIAEVDAERIEKVFENLLINALQAMDKKTGTLTVSATSDAENCTISVADTGMGMTEEYLRDKLFRAFATTKPLGIGLGLYTCREVIRAHGGSIAAESVKGSGTTFRVVLPLRAQTFWAT